MDQKDVGFTHRFLPAQSAGLPTLLLLHGTGGDETDLLGLGRRLLPGAALLSPRGKVLERGMPRFFRRLAEGIFDLEDLTLRTHELADFVQTAAAQYGFAPGRVVAVGFSNGANIAAGLLLLRPGVLAGAILLHPMVPLEPEDAPDLSHTPVFIGAGRHDPMVPVDQTERLAALLRQFGAPTDIAWQEDGHALTREEAESAREWLAKQEFGAGPANKTGT